MVYTADKPHLAPSSDELRARIPGWGTDLDPANRPGVPKMRFDPAASGAHWEIPEQQEEKVPRERSIEHERLPPVFGTAQPLKGLSGRIRRYAYERYSEARSIHWMLLILGDRVDSIESQVSSLLALKPDNPITETGVLAEFRRGGLSSRLGKNRADGSHQWIAGLLVAAPYVLTGVALVSGIRRLARRR
ncbi:hypothetical protein [Naasia sp. SYSU D00948]|uniref:hypothetical protein n=1 Tax=Naasia sp. SYSU D00948 TaxID=2817379 RepID=UPI001B3013F0|nr:hypothetical protein [Naasia sp. SYSU D00948]